MRKYNFHPKVIQPIILPEPPPNDVTTDESAKTTRGSVRRIETAERTANAEPSMATSTSKNSWS